MFVGGLRAGINENNLREYFSKFGKITEVIMIKHRDGRW
jgi:RNA recognition motif-containing protein